MVRNDKWFVHFILLCLIYYACSYLVSSLILDVLFCFFQSGVIRNFLLAFVGIQNYDNIQVSSRTDRGVHALKNTLHVDLRPRFWSKCNKENWDQSENKGLKQQQWNPKIIQRGLNFHLRRHPKPNFNRCDDIFHTTSIAMLNRNRGGESCSSPFQSHHESLFGFRGENDIRILNVIAAPLVHNYDNALSFRHQQQQQYQHEIQNNATVLNDNESSSSSTVCHHKIGVDYFEWNARFTATKRRYVYRILTSSSRDELEYIIPFECDRAWCLSSSGHLDVTLMKEGAQVLLGTHDFSSFRGKNCQRPSPIVTILNLQVDSHPNYYCTGGLFGSTSSTMDWPHHQPDINLVTISVTGTSFLYRQVRNIVGCLVKVGQGKISPLEVQSILRATDRRVAPAMAPPHGLFLVNVEHEGLEI